MNPRATMHQCGPMVPAVFLDRDGILNEVVIRDGTVSSPRSFAEFRLHPLSADLCRAIRASGRLVVVVTNQPDIDRGLLPREDLEAMHEQLQHLLAPDAIEVCTSGDDGDPRRKPNPGMLLDAAARLHIDLASSLIFGDSRKDIAAGRAAGVRTMLLETEYNAAVHGSADIRVTSIAEAIELFHTLQDREMNFTQRFLEQAAAIAGKIDSDAVERMVEVLLKTRESGGRLFLVGSGGGAGHSSHATCDFRKIGGFEAYCPTDNVSELSARINDEGWDTSLSNYLRGSRLRSGDCLFVFSVGGGNEEKAISNNLVNAVRVAREVGASVVGIVGRDGGYTAANADACVIVPTVDDALITAHTEAFQAVIWHLLVSHPSLQMNPMKWESTK